jgi:CRP-like cAMP-binding protein
MEPQHVDILQTLAQDVCFQENELILRDGEPVRRLYVILRGQVALEKDAGPVVLLGPGLEFGWSALLGRDSRFNARSLAFTHTLAFAAEGLLDACRQDPSFGLALYRRLLEVASDRLESVCRPCQSSAGAGK